MIIKKLKIKNIRSYVEGEINFPLGNILLSGEIGSGKSSVLLAIEYALFGLQPGQTGSALLRTDADNGEVILEVEISGQSLIIERRLKRTKTVVNDYSSYTLNGEKVECSITELKSKIISLLGYPREFIKKNNLLYKYTIYTPQESMKQIINEDADARLNILRHIFGVEKYKTIRENLTILLTKLKEESKVLLGETSSIDFDKNRLSSTKSFIAVLNEKISLQEAEVISAKESRKKIESVSLDTQKSIKEKENLEKELEKASVLLSLKRENLSGISREKSFTQKKIQENQIEFDERELEKLTFSINRLTLDIDMKSSKYIEFTSNIKSLDIRRSDMLSEKDRVFSMQMCPTCLQDVPAAHKHNILNQSESNISQINKDIKALKDSIVDLPSEIEKLKSEKSNLEKKKISLQILKSKIPEFENLKLKILDIEKNEKLLIEDVSILEKHISDLKQSILKYSKFQNIFKINQEELKKAFDNEKKSEISLAELKKELELTLKETEILQNSILEKEERKKSYLKSLELIDWLSNNFFGLIEFTERNVMFKLRNEFSSLFNKWFSLLVTDSFETRLDENFTPIIIQNGAELDYSFLSGGERTAVALAYRLALNQIVNSTITGIKTKDIIILDEPTEGFSENQTNKLRDIFSELNTKQLIIVSHEQKIEGFVDNVIKIKKNFNESKIETLFT